MLDLETGDILGTGPILIVKFNFTLALSLTQEKVQSIAISLSISTCVSPLTSLLHVQISHFLHPLRFFNFSRW